MKALHLLLLLVIGAISSISFAADIPEESPHAAAIRFVMTSRSVGIHKMDRRHISHQSERINEPTPHHDLARPGQGK